MTTTLFLISDIEFIVCQAPMPNAERRTRTVTAECRVEQRGRREGPSAWQDKDHNNPMQDQALADQVTTPQPQDKQHGAQIEINSRSPLARQVESSLVFID